MRAHRHGGLAAPPSQASCLPLSLSRSLSRARSAARPTLPLSVHRALRLAGPADAFSVRNTLRDSNVAGKIDASDKERLEKLVEETIEWMDHNQVGAGA